MPLLYSILFTTIGVQHFGCFSGSGFSFPLRCKKVSCAVIWHCHNANTMLFATVLWCFSAGHTHSLTFFLSARVYFLLVNWHGRCPQHHSWFRQHYVRSTCSSLAHLLVPSFNHSLSYDAINRPHIVVVCRGLACLLVTCCWFRFNFFISFLI